MNWTEAKIYTTTVGIDHITGALMQIGITGFVIEDAKDFENFLTDTTIYWDYVDEDLMKLKECETSVTIYLADNPQGKEQLAEIKSALLRLKSEDVDRQLGRLEITLGNIKEEDWENNWKQYFKPFEVGEKLAIKPSWETYENKENRIVLEIDPASSFGTGTHTTTQLCLENIEKYIKPNDRILDIGCGSGILSIGALLLGATSAFAVDIDENAVNISKENAEKNGFTADKFTSFCGNFIVDEKLRAKAGNGYDIIAANIVADVIIALSPIFKNHLKKGGILVSSGIIDGRVDEVYDAIKSNGFEILDVKTRSDWSSITAKLL
ncbi:MAG: 50S ribosomal protein L11 methyltransferase [Oscillospiraceae bacterium]|nr:50S ribosomal protein L11 methyltransferase [Oscillospiraceae bacterium]